MDITATRTRRICKLPLLLQVPKLKNDAKLALRKPPTASFGSQKKYKIKFSGVQKFLFILFLYFILFFALR